MGYDLHITRNEEWWESENAPITLEEWSAWVAAEDGFELTGRAEATTTGGDVISMESPGIATWSGHSSGNTVWFDWHDGRVVVKNPDDEITAVMKRIAQAFDAHVIGDEGESY